MTTYYEVPCDICGEIGLFPSRRKRDRVCYECESKEWARQRDKEIAEVSR